jgi:cell division protein FtsB
MVNFGLLFKNTSTGTFNGIMRYLEMRKEIKELTKANSNVSNAETHLAKAIKKHNVDKANIALKEMDEEARKVFVASHDLVMNDFVAMKSVAKMILEAEDVLKDEEKQLKHSAAHSKRMNHDEIVTELNELKKANGELHHVAAKEVFYILNKARVVVNGLTHLVEGKMDAAFLVKGSFFADNRWLNYFVMRYEAKDLRKKIAHAKKEEKELERHAKELRKYGVFGKNGKIKKVKKRHVGKFVGALRDAFKDIFKLFVKSMMMLESVIRRVRKEEFDVKKWTLQYEIPKSMGEASDAQVKKLLAYGKDMLHNLNYSINQLSSLQKQVG